MTTTKTPRTDAYKAHWPSCSVTVPVEVCRQLERSAKAWEEDALRYHQNECYWKERAERAWANLRRAVEIAEEFYENIPSAETMFLRESVEKLDQLRATLSEPNSLQPKPLTA